MKRICTYIISVLMLFTVNLPILAENSNLPQINKPKIITCDEKSTDEICKAIEITKTEIKLKSYLKDGGVLKDSHFDCPMKFKAYIYDIKNNSTKSIIIKKIQSKNPYTIIGEAIPTRICYQLLGIPAIALSAISIIGLPLMPIIIFSEIQSITLAPFRDTAALAEATQFRKNHSSIEIKPCSHFKTKLYNPDYKINFISENQEYSIISK